MSFCTCGYSLQYFYTTINTNFTSCLPKFPFVCFSPDLILMKEVGSDESCNKKVSKPASALTPCEYNKTGNNLCSVCSVCSNKHQSSVWLMHMCDSLYCISLFFSRCLHELVGKQCMLGSLAVQLSLITVTVQRGGSNSALFQIILAGFSCINTSTALLSYHCQTSFW